MVPWDYVVEDIVVALPTDRQDLAMALNEYGAAGWELVALSGLGASPTGGMGYRAVFKRPKREVSRLISATPKITAG